MIDLSDWTQELLNTLDLTFGNRVFFVGLQGSYSRGEATEASDIDPVVILDTLTASDIQTYGAMLDTLPHRELICGFLSGKDELLHWDASDLFQFYFDTTPIKGNLDELLSVIDKYAVIRAIKAGACNIYHGCIHNMLHGKSADTLQGLYKSASFVIQAIAFHQTGIYFRRQKDLLNVLSSDEQLIISTFLQIKCGGAIDFQNMSNNLLKWAQKWIQNTGANLADLSESNDELKNILLVHARRYPRMQPTDAVKLIYQNEFGGGHLIRDEAACLRYLHNEYENITKNKLIAPYEYIGNGIYRVNLAPMEETDLDQLGNAFILSAANHKGTMDRFLTKLTVLEFLAQKGTFEFSYDALMDYLSEYKKAGYPAVSHSEVYRQAYSPAYRIIER